MPRKKKDQGEQTANQQPIDGQSTVIPEVIKVPLGARAAAIRRDRMRFPELGPSALARRAGCSTQNVRQVLSRFFPTHTDEQLRQFQQNKADVYDATAYRFLESVTSAKLAKTPATSAIVAVGILHDKAALLRGQPTSINLQVMSDLVELIRGQDDE